MTPHPPPTLRSRVLQRVQASHAHESQFMTVRHDAAAWTCVNGSMRSTALARTDLARSSLVVLQAGCSLPVDPAFTQVELVVMGGQASAGHQALTCGDAACLPNHRAHLVRAEGAGARLFLRLSTPGRPEGEYRSAKHGACLMSAPDAPATGLLHFSTVHGDDGWDDFCPGVRIKPLWHGGERSSILVRMQAGASVNAHRHPLEEECLMLAGEAFVGDTLLRSCDYQLAPMGSRHGAVTTDVGALFYVHGSLDPAAYL